MEQAITSVPESALDLAMNDAVSSLLADSVSDASIMPPSFSAEKGVTIHQEGQTTYFPDEGKEVSISSMFEEDKAEDTPATEAVKPMAKKVSIGSDMILGDNENALAMVEAIAHLGSNSLSAFKIIAMHSGYATEMRPLNFQDIARLNSTATDAASHHQKIFKTVYNKMSNTTIKLSFKDFLARTAEADIATFYYGLYCATYPGKNKFNIPCNKCSTTNKMEVDCNDLARVADPKFFTEVEKYTSPNSNYEALAKNSLLSRRNQFELPSGLVVEIKNPSVQEFSVILEKFDKMQKNDRNAKTEHAGADVLISLSMYISAFYVPTRVGKYTVVSDIARKLDTVAGLSEADGTALQTCIDAEVAQIAIKYELPTFNCSACRAENKGVSLDFERILFMRIKEKA